MSDSPHPALVRCACCRDELHSEDSYPDADLGEVCPSCKLHCIAAEKDLAKAGFSGCTHNPAHEK